MATVCVFCASSDAIDPGYLELAAELGRGLAERGHELVTGGGSVSMMGAITKAARAAGGRTVGVIPKALYDLEVADHDADELVVTGDMRTRKAEMDRRADAFIAMAGGIGTLEELVEIWVASTLGMHAKPVVVLDADDLYAPLRAQGELMRERGFVRDSALDAIIWTTTADEALDALDRAWAEGQQPTTPEPSDLLEAEP